MVYAGLLKPALGGLGKSLLSVAKFLKLRVLLLLDWLASWLAQGAGSTLAGMKWEYDMSKKPLHWWCYGS